MVDTAKRAPRGSLEPHPDRWLNLAYFKGPGELATSREKFLNEVASGTVRSLSFGIPEIDAVIRTCWPGRLVTVVARPSNGKTSLMVHMARIEARRIMAAGTSDSEFVAFASLEEDESDIQAAITGGTSSAKLMDGELDVSAERRQIDGSVLWPCYIGGHAVNEVVADLDDLPPLSAEQIYRELAAEMKGSGKRPTVLFVDYLQIMEVEAGGYTDDKRNDSVGRALKTLRKIGKLLKCPVVVGVQAKESVDSRKPPIPEGGDAYYSSEVFHASDVMVSLYYPARYGKHVHGGQVEDHRGNMHATTKSLLWVQLLKQRKGDGRAGWLVRFDPATQAFSELPPNYLVVGGQS